MDSKAVAVDIQLRNEYGSEYGTLWLVFASTPQDANVWIHSNLDAEDGTPHYNNTGLWDQCCVEVITRYDENGNLSRSPWWLLAEQLANGNVKEDVIHAIADL